MKIAVVILNWNGKKLLKQFLPSVVKHSSEATVYVADNASTDDSVAFLKNNFPAVKIIQNRENGGYAKGYNKALKDLEEDIFILLNSDVEVTPSWLLPIQNHFETHPETAIVQPKLLAYKNKAYFEYAGAAGGFIDCYAFPFCRGRIFDSIEKDEGQYEKATPVFWASGACLCIRKRVFQDLGGLDESYFAHQEEIDLCWRAHNKNLVTMYLPKSVVYHLGGATLNEINPKKTYLNFRNSLYNLLKNSPSKFLFFKLFFRLSLDGLAGIKYLFEGKPKHTWAIIRAHLSFYKNLKQIKAKRQKIRNKQPYYAVKSVIWQYYMRKRKRFNQLR